MFFKARIAEKNAGDFSVNSASNEKGSYLLRVHSSSFA